MLSPCRFRLRGLDPAGCAVCQYSVLRHRRRRRAVGSMAEASQLVAGDPHTDVLGDRRRYEGKVSRLREAGVAVRAPWQLADAVAEVTRGAVR
jgi:hypothetical protein